MKRIVGGVLVLFLALPILAAEDKQTPQQQYQALVKEFQDGVNKYREAMTKAKTNEDRQKAFQQYYPRPDAFATKFLALAEKHPKDPAAVDALVWVTTNSPGLVNKDSPRSKALAVLQRDHVTSPKLAPICQRLVYGMDRTAETFLRTVLEKSPNKEVQGNACLALAQFLKYRGTLVQRLKDQPRRATGYEGRLGKEYVEELKKLDQTKVDEEIEKLLTRASKDYTDVKLGFGGTVGTRAKGELFEIRHLAIGKAAPDIEGQDQDGKKFKLSDYKGKVVFLDFWSQF
jgi:hypothetical protein